MLKLANTPLSLVDWEVESRINRWLSMDRIRPFLGRSWPGPGSSFLTVPTGYREWPPPLRLNRMWWPNGASRWACGAFVVDNSLGYATRIHDAAFGQDGTQINAVPLFMDSPDAYTGISDESLEIQKMYVMAIIPIKRVLKTDGSDGVTNGLYLFIVADERIFWWDIPTPDFGISEGAGKTWRNVIDSCQGALGTTIETSTIPSEYLAPSRALNLTGQPIPPVIDAIATNIGMRFIASYDRVYRMKNFEDSLNDYTQNLDQYPARSSKIIAGGERFMETL